MKRFLLGTLLLGTLLWVHPIAGFILAIVFGLLQSYRYYEIIAVAALVDIIYQTTVSVGFISLPLYTLVGVMFFVLSSRIQNQINIHA